MVGDMTYVNKIETAFFNVKNATSPVLRGSLLNTKSVVLVLLWFMALNVIRIPMAQGMPVGERLREPLEPFGEASFDFSGELSGDSGMNN